MRKHLRPTARQTRRGLTFTGLFVAAAVFLSGCASNGTASSGWLPQGNNGGDVTDNAGRVTSLWVGTWIAALAVGLIVWGLTDLRDGRLPPQEDRRRAAAAAALQRADRDPLHDRPRVHGRACSSSTPRATSRPCSTSPQKPDVTINVLAKQWSWDFNYLEADVYESGVQVELDKNTGEPLNEQPVLVLPVNKRVEFVLNARDVIHSFWVPAFLQKLDMLPGKTNRFQVTSRPRRAPSRASAPSCAAPTTRRCSSRSRSSPRQAYEAEIARLRSRSARPVSCSIALNREPVLPA